MTDVMMEFECQHLHKSYRTGKALMTVLEDLNFRVDTQEFVSLVGPSGCGKTTLLKIIADLVPPTSGHIRFSTAVDNGQPRSAMVFQEHGLLPWLSILENVAFGLEMQKVKKQERRRQAREFLARIGLAEFIESYPHQLSVGMRQRAAIARAFLAHPVMLLMDEPFSSLDAQTKVVLQEELLRLWQEHRKTVVYVTHDIEEAILLSDRILVMTGRPGRIREDIPITIPRPRHLVKKDYPEVQELRWHIWKTIEDEVRQSLHSTLRQEA
ncbi:MAG: ABC transporter ATP-binding protein [bacterium]|nr:ABC transporter ATP-binding protein [bacterium]